MSQTYVEQTRSQRDAFREEVIMKRLPVGWVTLTAFLGYASGVWGIEPRVAVSSAVHERGDLGTIAIVSARYAPTFRFHVHASNNGHSAKKSTVGALRGLWNGCGNFATATGDSGLGMLAFFGCAYLTPFVAAGGATFGALKARTARGGEVGKTKSAMKPVLTERGIQVVLQDHVVRQTRHRSSYTVVPRWDLGPDKPGQAVDYTVLADQGIDTILEVGVTHVTAMGEGANATLALKVVALARLIHAKEGRELYNHQYAFQTDQRALEEWAVNDPALRRLSEQACTDLAQHILRGAFPLNNSLAGQSAS